MPDIPRPTDVFLGQGDVLVSRSSVRIRTLLGSCVSITLWHPHLRVGAMSHFLLPRRGGQVQRGTVPGELDVLDARYGDEALKLMERGLMRLGAAPTECIAKAFGGGCMLRGRPAGNLGNVGLRNGEAARQMLAERGIALRSEHLFGDGHRQVVFDLPSGDVWVRQVPTADAEFPTVSGMLST